MTLVQTEPKKIYIRVEAQPITTAWIYWNEELGLISLSSDGSTRYTIADKNLWATSTDTTSSDSYGYYYQWGNNYGFPNSWSVTTSYSSVNASSYWPNNPYSDSTFRLLENWETSYNTNLRWDATDILVARKWPCDTWFHVPTSSETQSIINLCTWMWISSADIKAYIKLPLNWRRNYDGNVYEQWSWGYYWTSTTVYSSMYGNYSASTLQAYSWWTVPWSSYGRWNWYWVRPFKNEAVQPDETWTRLDA